MTATRSPGWYGKLPTTGDFIQNRLSESTVSAWFSWIQGGLQTWHRQHINRSDFLHAPVWNFVLPATLGIQRIQLGVIVPSQDRVGRLWPLLAVQNIATEGWHPSQLTLAGDWFSNLSQLLQDAVSQLQSPQTLTDKLMALPGLPLPALHRPATLRADDMPGQPHPLAWPDVVRYFDPQQYTSYWWTQPNAQQPLKTHRHSGNLTAHLFTLLFNPRRGALAGRNGLYPPMFE